MSIYINGELLPPAAVEHELERLVKFYTGHLSQSEIREQLPHLKRKAVDQAIGGRLLMEQAANMDIHVPDDKLEEAWQAMVATVGGQANLENALHQAGKTIGEVRHKLEDGLKVDLLVDSITKGISDPTEDDIETHYNAHRSEYRRPDRASVRHILITCESESGADRAAACSRLGQLRLELQNGAQFEDLASVHSECPSGKSHGGSLGWIDRGTALPELDEVFFSLAIQEISEVVESSQGLHLVEVTGRVPGGEAPLAEVRESIREFLRHVDRGAVLAAYVKDLRDKADIQIT